MVITIDDAQSIVGNNPTISQLENGGQKEVFRVINEPQNFVLKFVKIEDQDEDDPDYIIPLSAEEERTYREIRLMSSVNSDYLPDLGPIEIREFTKDGLRHLVFSEEYIGDKSVKDLIREGYFDTTEKVNTLLHDVTQALVQYSNFEDGFVHRDVKPGNIVQRDGNDQFVLIDGGVHMLPSNPTITSSRAFIGTRKYASPEQLTQGRRHVDSRSDIFSLGVVLYEAAARKHPFYYRGVSYDVGLENHINARYSPINNNDAMSVFNSLLDRMITRYPHTRYTSLEDLLLDIEGVLG